MMQFFEQPIETVDEVLEGSEDGNLLRYLDIDSNSEGAVSEISSAE